jgi:hypothetical protein
MFDYKQSLDSSYWTDRPNHLGSAEGGALNAGYTPVDALCKISNELGRHGLEYGKDWWWVGFNTNYQATSKLDNLEAYSYRINIEFAKAEHSILLPLTEEKQK